MICIDLLIAKPSYKFLMYINQLHVMPAKHKSSVTQPQSVLCVLYFGTNLTQLFLLLVNSICPQEDEIKPKIT